MQTLGVFVAAGEELLIILGDDVPVASIVAVHDEVHPLQPGLSCAEIFLPLVGAKSADVGDSILASDDRDECCRLVVSNHLIHESLHVLELLVVVSDVHVVLT